jgi:hypothetical protein
MHKNEQITGLILAGGRGTRMGSVNKGLQPFRGTTMAQHVLERLAPQVGSLAINANSDLERYAAFGLAAGERRDRVFARDLHRPDIVDGVGREHLTAECIDQRSGAEDAMGRTIERGGGPRRICKRQRAISLIVPGDQSGSGQENDDDEGDP